MRLFIATTFPAAAIDPLNARVGAIRSRLPGASWVRPESQHLTFGFLGEQPESIIDTVSAHLTASLAKVPRFEATLHDCGFFPNPRHARVGWMGVEPESGFNEVARAVREAVIATGLTLDRDTFRSHLTLVRIRDQWPPACIELFSRTLRDFRSEPFVVDKVTLFSSNLQPSGAIHTPQREFEMGSGLEF
ncbi:MAG TPA: RNA 2',3'-cyclic phosphodiesterase [Thermoanaerobaculia bacterium]|nr:RNA 2',3'-cyclic phosphodiesterase [Thermoanaerobaculia bacterium]